MLFSNIYKILLPLVYATCICVGSVLAQATQEKPAWTAAKPTKTATTPAVTTSKEKPAVTIGKQREQEKPAAEDIKKKSKLTSAVNAAKRAAPELIKQGPALIQSAKNLYAGTTDTHTAQPKTQKSVYAGYIEPEEEEEEEINDADRIDEE